MFDAQFSQIQNSCCFQTDTVLVLVPNLRTLVQWEEPIEQDGAPRYYMVTVNISVV